MPCSSFCASSGTMSALGRRVEAAVWALRRLVSTLCGVIPSVRPYATIWRAGSTTVAHVRTPAFRPSSIVRATARAARSYVTVGWAKETVSPVAEVMVASAVTAAPAPVVAAAAAGVVVAGVSAVGAADVRASRRTPGLRMPWGSRASLIRWLTSSTSGPR